MENSKASSKKKSILCVANWDSNVGYAWWLMESFWLEINKHFAPQYRIVICFPTISELPKHIENSSIETVQFDLSPLTKNSIRKQISFLQELNVTAIYFSDQPLTKLKYIAYRACGVKSIIIHDHTPGDRTTPRDVKKVAKQILKRLPFINADLLIGATKFVRERNINSGCFPPPKCYTAANGIDLSVKEALASEARTHEKFGIPTDKKIIVSACRANEYKNIEFALTVIAKTIKQYNRSDLHYLFLGDGPNLDNLKTIAKTLGISEHVYFAGYVQGISSHLKNCYAAIHPSRGEVGYSLAILEEMYAEIPVIVPDTPSVCECITHRETGLIYPESDVNTAAEMLNELLDKPALQKVMGANAKQAVISHYNLKQTHTSLIEAINKVIQFS